MVGLVGVSGLAGAGKSTAVDHLAKLTGGRVIYLGKKVIDEVPARSLPQTRDNECRVRIDLRREKGPAALAIPYVDEVTKCFKNGIPVFIDAIFKQEEFDLLTSHAPSDSARLLAIEASFDIRSERLARRPERPLSADELRKRDTYELNELGIDAIFAAADSTIRNEGTKGEFYASLAELLSSWA